MLRVLIGSLASLLISAADETVEPPAFFRSFEETSIGKIASTGGLIVPSNERIQHGAQSLRWDFSAGDSITFDTGPLGNVGVWTGYGGYSRSALVLPIFLPTEMKGKLRVEVRAGEQTAATIEIPFAHIGWQKLVYHYSWNSGMTWLKPNLRPSLDNIRFVAVGTEKPGSIFLDAVNFNIPRDFRDARGAVQSSWHPADHDFSDQHEPTATELERIEQLARALVPQPSPNTSSEHWQRRIDQVEARIRTEKLHQGNPLTKAPHRYYGLLNGIAENWCQCADETLRREFARQFHTINDWLQEQGLVVNGMFGRQNNYVGRIYVDAITKMRTPLEEHGSLKASLNFLKWSYFYDEQVFGDQHQESMDYFHNEALRLLRIALTHGDPVARFHHVSRFRETLEIQLATSIKPDGAIYHHGFHYFAYGSMGMNSISGVLSTMSAAGLPVGLEGLNAVKTALMKMRWYSGRTTLWSLAGRNASGTQSVPTHAFLNLAKAYQPYLSGKPEPELAAAYLRFHPDQRNTPLLQGIAPETSPNGYDTMPFAALGMQRRDHWLAGVKGYSKYAASGESYANSNRFGIYMAHGQLELLTHPQPFPTVHGSGTQPDQGYDWAAIEGATTAHAPLDRLANGNGTRIPYSPETYVGALTNGSNGMFAMKLNDNFTRRIMADNRETTALTARKSWFFFDNRIVCLGSDISTSHVDYPIRTNLFQKFISEEHPSAQANGKVMTPTTPARVEHFSAESTQLIDPYQNTYIIPSAQQVSLRLGEQQSRNNSDTKDTRGTYATAWIEHGKNPTNARYEYLVLVQAESEQVQAAGKQLPYTVIRCDSQAHIVRDHATHTTAYVLYTDTALTLPDDPFLQSVSQPCIVMIQDHADQLLISATIPDTRPGETTPQTLTLTLKGHSEPITFDILHAESHQTRIQKLRPTE